MRGLIRRHEPVRDQQHRAQHPDGERGAVAPPAPDEIAAADLTEPGDDEQGDGPDHRAAHASMRPMRLPVLVVAALALFATGAWADNVDSYLEAEMAKRKIPGVALAVVQRGAIVKMKGYGTASVELDVPVSPDSVFELASITKQFTAS